ncbi:MAG TPA: hypothetical protein ENG51_07545 [Deltaproteobacteria bacterium]|nr:hypothetical protein [Deltaproteobacteria bacterium]
MTKEGFFVLLLVLSCTITVIPIGGYLSDLLIWLFGLEKWQIMTIGMGGVIGTFFSGLIFLEE